MNKIFNNVYGDVHTATNLFTCVCLYIHINGHGYYRMIEICVWKVG